MAFTFISGATGGIGSAFAKECAKKGYDLFLTGRDQQKLLLLKNELKSFNVKIYCSACDLTSETSRKQLIDYIEDNDIIFDRIINVAGVDTQKGFLEYTLEKVLFQLRVNVEGTIALTHQLLQKREKSLEIITISSMSGATPMPYFALYSASKSMLASFFISLHYELKKKGVKVTVVMPGGVPTRPDIIKDIQGQGIWGKLSKKSPQFVAKKSLEKVKKNKLRYIPGFFNKLLYFTIKIAPKRIVYSVIAKRWSKISKDAF